MKKKEWSILKKSLMILSGLMILILASVFLKGLNVNAAPGIMPLPVISRNCPAYASVDIATNANDANYGTTWKGNSPGWLAYDLSGIPVEKRAQVVVVWYNPDTYDYDPTIKNTGTYGSLNSYTVQANTAAGGTSAPTSGWVTLATVTNNMYHSRQHAVNLSGYNWVRLNVTASNPSGGNWVSINFDVHDAGLGVQDDWIFYGDSITAGGMVVGSGTTFAQMINAKSSYFPIAECGGTGSIFSTDGANKISTWLSLFPGKYVGIAFGTNDAWGNQTGAAKYYTNTETMVKAVIAAGKVPVVSKIPYSKLADISNNAPSYNAQIDALYAAYPQIIKGPDLWTFFQNNPNLLSGDNVHPSADGYVALRQQWADAMLATVYNGVPTTPTPTTALTPTPVVTPTRTPTPVITATPTSVRTATPRRTATPVRTATPRRTITPGRTATPGITVTPTPVRTATPVITETPVVTTVPPVTPTPGTGGIKIQFYNQNTAATTNQLYLNIKLLNTGNSAITLSNVRIRYYYTIDGPKTQNFYCDYSPVGSSNVNGTFVTMSAAKTGADTYVEVGFGSGAGSLAAGGSTTIQARVAKSDWTNYTQTNDYSFNSSATTFVDWTQVTGYVSDSLQWGTEP
jgi:lysophospholipase L1-like esterase